MDKGTEILNKVCEEFEKMSVEEYNELYEKVTKMENEQTLSLVRELVKDWVEGRLSDYSAKVAINSILFPVKPSQQDIDWATGQ